MDSSVASVGAPDARSQKAQHGGLKRGSIGLVGLVVLGAVMMSPALGIYGLWGPMESTVGVVTPLVFLAALAVAVPTAISYSLISRSMPSTGSAFSWVWRAISPTAGLFVGLMMAIYYTIAVLLQPLLFGLFFNDLLTFCGAGGVGTATILLGAALVTVPVMFLTYRGIEASTKSAVLFILVEIAVVVALAVTIVVSKGASGDLTLAPFDPSNTIGGVSGFWGAMILGILAFTGFDVISTVAEEAQAPRRLLPKATLLAAITVGLFWAATSWAFSISEPVATVQAYTEAGTTAVTPLANHYWAWGRIFVILTGMTAATACYVATAIGASRSIFAIARHGQLPAALGRLHPRFQVPWNAMHVVYGLVVVGVGALTLALDNAVSAFVWWASALVFFALVTYLAVNLVNIVHFARDTAEKFNWFLNGLIPAVGIGIDGYLLYKSFFKALWEGEWSTGKSIVVVSMALMLLGLIYAIGVRLFASERLAEAPAGVEDVPHTGGALV